ncbi:MAG: hypothetical protein ACK4N5_05525 [Myxococcales bacterium]
MSTERQIPDVGEEIHLPGPSAQPLLVTITATIMLIGVTQPSPVYFIFGLVTLLMVLAAWTRDAIAEFKALPDHHDHGDDHDAHDAPAAGEHAAPEAH